MLKYIIVLVLLSTSSTPFALSATPAGEGQDEDQDAPEEQLDIQAKRYSFEEPSLAVNKMFVKVECLLLGAH